MRVARAAFLAGPALLLIAALALAASLVGDRRHGRRRVAAVDDDEAAPAPVARRDLSAPRIAPQPMPPAAQEETRRLDSLRLHIEGPHGLRLRAAEVTAVRGDSARNEELKPDGDGMFTLDGLTPGTYDVTATADGLADTFLAGVRSDAVGVRLLLTRPPVLVGALGGGDRSCSGMQMRVSQERDDRDPDGTAADDDDGDDGDEREVALDDDCTFKLDDLERGTDVKIEVPLDDHVATATVPVPNEGDPPPLCLAAPCASLPSAVVVLAADGEGFFTSASYSWDAVSGDGIRGGGRTGPSGPLVIAGLTAGTQLHVKASARRRQMVDAEMAVPFGVTELVLTLSGAD